MDYLDPIKKRKHRIRLYIGYGLMTVAIAIATVILVYVGNGFYVDRSTGVLIQNGQLFVNSDPDGAKIYLNGREQRTKTAGRLVVPSGTYNITIKRDGYRDWTASNVVLDGGVVKRLDYARLLPTTLKPLVQQTFATVPYAASESIDRRYMVFQFANTPLNLYVMDLTRPETAAKEIALPKALFTDQAKIGQLTVSEWADDNKHFIVKNVFNGVNQDYILVNRDVPAESQNLNATLKQVAKEVSFRDRNFDQFFVYDPAAKTLSMANLTDKVLNQILTDVHAYKTFGDDTVLYITATGANKGKMQARLFKDDKSYLMREVAESPSYLLAMGKLGSAPVMAIGVTSENKVTILRDPLTYLKANTKQTLPLAVTILQVPSPTEVSFSTDQSAVMVRGAQLFAAHLFEEDRSVKFELPLPINATAVQWVDGKHMTVVSGGFSYMFDYNGENVQKLVETIDGIGTYFDNSYQSAYTFTTGTGGKLFNVNRSLLRANN